MPPAGAPRWIGLVSLVTGVQALVSYMIRVPILLGAPLTLAAGVPADRVGQLAAATSLGSMIYFVWGTPALASVSSLRQLQGGCLLCAAAVLLLGQADWSLTLLGALLLGVGYGPSAPAGSDLLMRAVPSARRGVVFSIKQAGVPLGGLVAGLALPFVALRGGDGAALWMSAGLALGSALLVGVWSGLLAGDGTGAGATHLSVAGLLRAPVRLLRDLARVPEARAIALAGLGLGVAQGILFGFYPVFLIEHAGWSLGAAGLAFAVVQGTGVAGRILMGWLGDRSPSFSLALLRLCLVSTATMLLIAAVGPGTPAAAVLALSALAGLTIASWNGVYLAGLAGAAPPGQVSEMTAAGTFLLFAGMVASPLAVQAILSATQSYPAGFGAAALGPALAAVFLILRRRA